MFGGVLTRHDQCVPHGKEKLLLQDPLSQKGKLFTCASTRNHRKRILRCKWTSVALVIVSSEGIEPNDNDLEVSAVAYAFAKIFQPETCWNVANKRKQFLRRLRTPLQLLRRFSPQRRTEKRKNALSLLWKISLSSGSIYEHKNFYRGRKKVHQIDDEARLSRGTIAKTKQLSPTNLAFMQLVSGDDRAVRHICIRCIAPPSQGTKFTESWVARMFVIFVTYMIKLL